MQRIQSAAKSANFHAIVSKLPMGYLTVISDGCSTLSSGQGSAAGLAGAAAAGAAAGFFGGPATFPAIVAGAEVGFHAGLIGGGVEKIINDSTPADPTGLNYAAADTNLEP